ncbi:alkaline phosphatase family protein [Paramaledivibacter caminithermalis]|uniref:alkaline phosphatase family protein n=1 Tax=Paramaledivibacter caminithermalis TaxID=191027 RepID=UPI000934EB03|nr:alkaline phosphatase family protein [Paramaledivibacter caminithermalis]
MNRNKGKSIISGSKVILIIIGAAFLIIGALIGRMSIPSSEEVSTYIPELKIVGDVNELVSIHDFKSTKEENSFIALQELVDTAKPVTKNYDVLLVGEDGLFAQIESKNIDDCKIRFSHENGWQAVTQKHPINSKIKRIKEIVVVSKENTWDYGFNVISSKENILNITPGQFYLKELVLYPYFDGKSTKTEDGRKYNVELYKHKKLLPIKSIVKSNQERLLMMGKNGVYEIIDNKGYLEVMNNRINYINPEKRKQIHEIQGIMTEIPSDTIMNTYYDALHYIENDERVLILFLDGFGYHQYEYALSKGYIPFMGGLDNPKMAASVYKPVTNAGFAAMITGQPPNINGVYDRKYKDLKTESIFGKMQKMGKEAVLVEGDIKILNTEIQPILNIDKNKNGTRDDEIFESALKAIKNEPDLALVHFHSIDDMGHEKGDFAKETMETLKTIDGYVKELCNKWDGKIMIVSDHGIHSTAEGGTHGVFRYEDLIVPYFVFEGADK